jgi:hypothetical protein
MRKHKFVNRLIDGIGSVVGAQCAECSKIVNCKDGVVPPEILKEECPVAALRNSPPPKRSSAPERSSRVTRMDHYALEKGA